MSRKYTAQEMRELADRMFDYRKDAFGLELYDCRSNSVDCDATHDVICMLRQAADMMEREKKYEYRIDYVNRTTGNACSNHCHFESLQLAKRYATPLPDEEVRFLRREVGEWEEVRDE